MKGKKFHVALIGLIIIGMASIFIYRQQQEARALEFEGYEIESIESRVDGLFNDDETDIKEDIESELLNLEQIFSELNNKNLSNRSEKHMEKMEEKLVTAKTMHTLQENILNIFNEDEVIQKNISLENVEELETLLVTFEDKTVYHKRNKSYITEARVQIETTEEATELVEKLMTDDALNEEVNEENLDELEALIQKIKDETLKKGLLERLETARLILEQRKIAELALKETEEVKEVDDVVEDEVVDEESVEVVQETSQINEQPPKPTTQKNNQSPPTQSQPSTNKQPSSSKTNQKPNESSNQSSNSSNTQTNTVEQRPGVARQYQETKVLEEIPFQTKIYENKNIAAGEEIVYVEGAVGKVTETYEIIEYTNGTSSKKIISKDQTQPVDRVVTVGTKESE